MKFLSTSAFFAAILASATLAAASLESGSGVHAPAGVHHALRRDASSHHGGALSKRKCKSSSRKNKKTSSSSKTASTDNDVSDIKTSNSSSSTSGSGRSLKLAHKQGLAWPNVNGMNIDNFLVGDVDWYYSWGATPGWDSAPTDKLFCPMLWGDSGSGGNVGDFKKNVLDNPNGKYNKYKCMMGPNEVNQKGQSDMSVSGACSLMRKYMMPLADQGWYFIGPSTTSDPAGLTSWYTQFQKECSDVFERFDAIALHYYDTSISGFKKYVQNWHEKTGKDVWITEFACQSFTGQAQCSKSEAYNMLKEMGQFFDETDYVIGYSPFGAMQNLQGVSEVNRLSVGSSPTSLFHLFANL